MTEKRTPEVERAALDALIHSDGWAILREITDANYGPAAQIAAIDAVMTKLEAGDMQGQQAVVTQIRAASIAAFDVLARTESRFKQLEAAEQKKKQPAARYQPFRRGPS